MIKNLKIVIKFRPSNQSFTNISSLQKKSTPQIYLILRQFNFYVLLICRKKFVTINFFPSENEVIKHDLVEFKVQCLKVFRNYSDKPTILLSSSIFRTTLEVSSKLYFVQIC